MRKLLYISIIFSLLLSLFQFSVKPSEAAFNCTLPLIEDGGRDPNGRHWAPPTTKSTAIWFTVEVPSGFPNKVSALIKYEHYEPVPIGGRFDPTGGTGTWATYDLKDRNKIYLRGEDIGIGTANSGAGTYFNLVTNGVNKWRQGNYKLILINPGDDKKIPLCTVSFRIEPYCAIDINGGPSDWVPEWVPSFRVTKFSPYEAGGVNPGTRHFARLTKDGDEIAELIDSAENMISGRSYTGTRLTEGTYQIQVLNGDDGASCKSNKFTIAEGGGYEGCRINEDCDDPDAICLPDSGDGVRICGLSSDYLPGKIPLACVTIEPKNPDDPVKFECKTAIGKINTNPDDFATSILTLLLSLAGTILIALLIINGYKLMTSQGDPEKIKDAREGIIAAIAGVFLIIFSLSILRLITVDILGIPGFS